LNEKYIGTEKIAAIEAGADEYIQWPETMQEFVSSCYALIRRFTVLNKQYDRLEDIVLQGGVLIYGDYRKVFVRGMEVLLAGREFEFFKLLAAYPGRVFTYGQLFERIWGNGQLCTENSLHSCVRRIRRKLEGVPECPCSIVNMHNVGYFFRHNNS